MLTLVDACTGKGIVLKAAVLPPVNVCCANRRNVWHILELRFTLFLPVPVPVPVRLTDFDRTFEWTPLFVTTSFCHKILSTLNFDLYLIYSLLVSKLKQLELY
jgi:hypothetical protein